MRKNLNLLLAFAVCALCASGAQAGTPESAAFIDRGRSLFDFGRWTDARHEFLQARETLSGAAFCSISLTSVSNRPRLRLIKQRSAPSTAVLWRRCAYKSAALFPQCRQQMKFWRLSTTLLYGRYSF